MTSGLVLCCMSIVKKPMKLWVVPLCADQVVLVFLMTLT